MAAAHALTTEFLRELPAVREMLQTDVEAAFVGDPAARTREEVIVAYPFIEREFYFTTDKSPVKIDSTIGEYQYDMSNNRANFKLRIPDRSMYFAGAKGIDPKAETQKFIPPGLEWSSNDQPVIAPVMPERYAVVGA